MMLFCFIKCITTTGNACSAPMCLKCVNISVLIKVMKRENKRTSVGHRSRQQQSFLYAIDAQGADHLNML